MINNDGFEPGGVYPALPTPRNEDGSINYETARNHIEYLAAGGVDGIVPAGCTGHAAYLSGQRSDGSMSEHAEYVSRISEIASDIDSELDVIAGDGMNVPEQTIELASEIEEVADIDAHLMISPYQVGTPQEDIVEQHYQPIAEAVDEDIIAYNVPGRTGVNIFPETVLELAEIPGIVGIKEASNDRYQIRQLGRMLRRKNYDNFHLGSGDDFNNPLVYEEGGDFTISVTGNILPEETVQVWEHGVNGDEADQVRAETLNELLMPAHNAMFQDGEKNPQSVQYALNQMGFNHGTPGGSLDREPREDEIIRTQDGEQRVFNQTEIDTVLDHFDLREEV
ncbi:dihydrodipicolinate synthase family protein [Candidatus Nanohalobium constans]|uniref:4-hydroxy-tetrahydrodipicolinate synthase n=1 Tax=Candidatus Nanohalobium constans TaxID=2565781 RepID=A0A5Q0UFR3_9ARCH|nr:dihydrodipicolinate synthase family protein [Candidatus Nanohalobium constans]QGA80438.1 4-hydroxy-tetrahydrodipicolinate synthase [Candidatus Nanohalobium constans]